jgi:hypothetical protein
VLVFLVKLPAIGQMGRLRVIDVFSNGLTSNLLGDSANRKVTVYLPAEYDEVPKRVSRSYISSMDTRAKHPLDRRRLCEELALEIALENA